MADIRLDPATGDIDISGNQLHLTEEGPESTAQRLKIKLGASEGEWGFNIAFGIRYYDLVYVKGSSKALVDAEFRENIINTPGVSQILEFKSTVDNPNRTYQLDFTVADASGEETSVTLFQ